ncbi:flavodoxin domain-containing protein [Dactylosporangium sp. CA-092794]|uniref:flavodoxin domain-containing protein n=1 Tax=Dactylosporangium sp. CA-092794 TaxID=3239929 RepID=UPI003D911D47
MRVLVIAASKHGSTTEIAELIGAVLGEEGHDATTADVGAVGGPDGWGAVVLGSAVYAGQWLRPAVHFADRHAAALAARPVWLFSSGPIGDPPIPRDEAVDVRHVVAAVQPVEHRIFPGALHRSRLGFAERALVAALRAPYGDFRDWDAVRHWARQIAADLTQRGGGPGPSSSPAGASGTGRGR